MSAPNPGPKRPSRGRLKAISGAPPTGITANGSTAEPPPEPPEPPGQPETPAKEPAQAPQETRSPAAKGSGGQKRSTKAQKPAQPVPPPAAAVGQFWDAGYAARRVVVLEARSYHSLRGKLAERGEKLRAVVEYARAAGVPVAELVREFAGAGLSPDDLPPDVAALLYE